MSEEATTASTNPGNHRSKPRAKRVYRPNETGEIDKERFEELCKIDCTREEMCAALGCSHAKIEKWCRATYGARLDAMAHHFRNLQNAEYRKRQDFLATQSKNPEMLKFLGKVRLGQKETNGEKQTGKGGNFFQIIVGKPPAQLDGPPPPPVRKLINCGEAKVTEAVEPADAPLTASSLLRKARESIDATFTED